MKKCSGSPSSGVTINMTDETQTPDWKCTKFVAPRDTKDVCGCNTFLSMIEAFPAVNRHLGLPFFWGRAWGVYDEVQIMLWKPVFGFKILYSNSRNLTVFIFVLGRWCPDFRPRCGPLYHYSYLSFWTYRPGLSSAWYPYLHRWMRITYQTW